MTPSTRPANALILLTIERTGSTWLSDAIRCHPAVKYWPTGIICKDFKLSRFRRYPMDLSNHEDATETIEVSPGKWEKIPNFNDALVPDSVPIINEAKQYAIEKFHPHFFKFNSIEFIKSITYLEDLGVAVKLIYLVRDPEAAITSFMNYQKRKPSSHKETTGKEIITYMQNKYQSILEVSRYYPGLILDYANVKSNLEETLQKIYDYLWPHANLEEKQLSLTVSRKAGELTSRSKRIKITSSPFLGKKEGKIKGTTDEYKSFFEANYGEIKKCYKVYNKLSNLHHFSENFPGENAAINYFCIANLWKRENKFDVATTNYQKAIIINPKSPWFYNGLGESFARQENWGKAVICYRQAITINPNSAWFNFGLATALVKQGNIDEAVTCYQKAIALRPNQSIIQKKLQDIYKEYHDRAEKCLQENNREEAIANYQKAIKFNPDFAWSYFGLGKALHHQEQVEDAIASYRKAIELNPKVPDFYHWLGEALTRQGQLEDAIASYQEALKLTPNAAHCYRGLGYALYKKGELEEAINFLKRSIELSPKYVFAHNQLGEALFAHRDFYEAITYYQKSIELNSTSPLPYGKIAEILAEEGKIAQAVQYYQNAVKLDSKHQARHPDLVAALSPSE